MSNPFEDDKEIVEEMDRNADSWPKKREDQVVDCLADEETDDCELSHDWWIVAGDPPLCQCWDCLDWSEVEE